MKTEPLPSYGEHMTLDEFIAACKSGAYIDYDGSGNYATTTELFTDWFVCPSDVVRADFVPKIPAATHICWFNK